tara:strand:+ start:3357 stop:3608 length:252 start_codon:yes stop_codon:yes gene_type:complete
MWNNITYNIVAVEYLDEIDFTQIEETSIDTIRYSIDQSMFTIKWTTQPTFLTDESVSVLGTYSHEDMLIKMDTSSWISPPEDI